MNWTKLLFVLLLTSCSSWFNEIVVTGKEKQYNIKKRNEPYYCSANYNSKVILAGGSKSAQKLYQAMLKSIKTQNIKLKAVDELVLWALIQTNLRPDKASLFARLQVLIYDDNKEYYYDFFDHKNNETPSTLIGLKKVLRSFRSDFTIYQLMKLYKEHLINQLQVDQELSNFLYQNKDQLNKDSIAKKYFFRGEQVLRNTERIPKINFASLYQKLAKKNEKNLRVIDKLYPLMYNKNQFLSCNFDVNLYQNKFVFVRSNKVTSHVVSYSKNKFHGLIAMTLSNPTLNTEYGYPVYLSSTDSDNAAFCSIEKNQKRVLATVSNTRDNAQILTKLMTKMKNIKLSIEQFAQIIAEPRSIRLKKPNRFLIEPNYDESLDVPERYPQYSVKEIGRVWGLFLNDKRSVFVDNRSFEELSCPQDN